MGIIIVLLLLVIVVWAVFAVMARRSVLTDLDYLLEVSEHLNIPELPDFDLLESTTSRTIFTDGEVPNIHICIRKPDGKPFNHETVIIAYIHELSHLICPDEGHTNRFYRIESELLTKARNLGYLTDDSAIDPEYPCVK